MRNLDRRLRSLEARVGVPEEEQRRHEPHEILSRLHDKELDWISEPMERAAETIPCPHHPDGIAGIVCSCGDTNARVIRGFEVRPDLYEEYLRRCEILQERSEEIMEREPAGVGGTPEKHDTRRQKA